ncbi:adenylyltransferase/cytidyltransferase family protein [Micromonospora sp. NPDC047527]|uniref:adenylyltransferase/cytidyltransferase family protein n=1 Tax=Micromonospora sp. NPDC047527 TaxID=3155144 RepID=UPI0033F62305
MTTQNIADLCAAHRQEGRSIVFTHGAFDLLHTGHITFLENARTHGDVLVVGVHLDRHIRAYKGRGRPFFPFVDRVRLVGALRIVDAAVECPDSNAVGLVRQIRPDVYVKDNQADVMRGPEAGVVASYGGRICIVPYTPGISTSLIIGRLRDADRTRPVPYT